MNNLLITASQSDLANILARRAKERRGFRVITTSRSEHSPATTENHQHLSGVDLVSEVSLQRLAQSADAFFDGPFGVVHFAGNYWKHKPLVHTSFDEVKGMVESHYLSLVGVAKFLTPVLIKKGGGRLVAMSCNSVAYNYPDLSPFTAPKAAIESFIKSYANEYAEFSIAATGIALPTMRTPKVLDDKTEGDHENYIDPEEFARIVLDQVLPESRYSTGNTMRLIKYSSTFYNKSYFDRNPRHDPIR
jgi:NAD(P)-dependent dehydrogenase (short-subunit alcohol dehydrogenase family)